MSKLEIYILKRCPYCKQAKKHVEELLAEHSIFQSIEIEWVDERKEKERADAMDYYLVPSFFVNGEKLHEGGVGKDKVASILKQCVES